MIFAFYQPKILIGQIVMTFQCLIILTVLAYNAPLEKQCSGWGLGGPNDWYTHHSYHILCQTCLSHSIKNLEEHTWLSLQTETHKSTNTETLNQEKTQKKKKETKKKKAELQKGRRI